MAKCGVCGKNRGTRVISNVPFCDECFGNLQKIRNHDIGVIKYYLDPQNYADATEEAKRYMMEQAREKAESYEQDLNKQSEFKPYENVIMTTTNVLEGYHITKYLGIVCGEVVVPNGLLGAITSGTFFTINSLGKARTEAIEKTKENAYDMGANAVVAVDIDINDLNGNGVMVSVNGTAVFIEEEKVSE